MVELVSAVGWLGRIEPRNPDLGETRRMLAECAMLLADGAATSGGGVLTPATAFGLVLVDRLLDAGMVWRVEPWPNDGAPPTP